MSASIALDDLKPLPDWQSAKKGALTAFYRKPDGTTSQSETGMRAEGNGTNLPFRAMVVLSGPDAGTLLEDDHLAQKAFDLTETTTIAVEESAIAPEQSRRGLGYVIDRNGDRTWWLAIRTPSGQGVGYVCVAGSKPEQIVGSLVQRLDNFVPYATTLTVRKKASPTEFVLV